MQTLSSARRTCIASASAVECTATVRDAQLAAGALDAQRDLAAIGDQDFLEQRRAYSRIISGFAVLHRRAVATRMRVDRAGLAAP